MQTLPADRLENIAVRLLEGAGASEDEAATVSRHSIGANLAGHDSHGIIQIPRYIDRMKQGDHRARRGMGDRERDGYDDCG